MLQLNVSDSFPKKSQSYFDGIPVEWQTFLESPFLRSKKWPFLKIGHFEIMALSKKWPFLKNGPS